MNTKIKLTLFSLCGLLLLPVPAAASGAMQLDDTSILFTIDFSFSDNIFDVAVPLQAENNVSYLDRVDTLGYVLQRSDTDGAPVDSLTAIVLSEQPLVGDRYHVPKGETGEFTLLILATFSEPIENDYRTYITKLPYWLDERRTTVHQNQLDDLAKPVFEAE